jgi:hypothetical protein
MAEAKEYGPFKTELALLGMDIEELAKQLLKAVKDPNFWDYNKQPAAPKATKATKAK